MIPSSLILLLSFVAMVSCQIPTVEQRSALRSFLIGIGCARNTSACPPADSPTVCTDTLNITVMRINCTAGLISEIRIEGQRGIGGFIDGQHLARLTALTSLSLSMINVTGTIPPAIGALTQLRVLKLSKNGLFGPMPTEIAGLAALTDVQVNDNANLFGATGSFPTVAQASTCLLQRTCFRCDSPTGGCLCDSGANANPNCNAIEEEFLKTKAAGTQMASLSRAIVTTQTPPRTTPATMIATAAAMTATTRTSQPTTISPSQSVTTSPTPPQSWPDVVVIASASAASGVFLLTTLLILCVCVLRRRRRNNQHSDQNQPTTDQALRVGYADVNDIRQPLDNRLLSMSHASEYGIPQRSKVQTAEYDAPDSTLQF